MPRIKVRAKNTATDKPFTHEAAVPGLMTGADLVGLCRDWNITLHLDQYLLEVATAKTRGFSGFGKDDMLIREEATQRIDIVSQADRTQWTMPLSGGRSPTYRIEPAPVIEAFRYDGTADIPDLMAWVREQGVHVSRCEILGVATQVCYLYGLKGHLAQYGISPGCVVICSANISQEIKLAVWGGWPLDDKYEVVE